MPLQTLDVLPDLLGHAVGQVGLDALDADVVAHHPCPCAISGRARAPSRSPSPRSAPPATPNGKPHRAGERFIGPDATPQTPAGRTLRELAHYRRLYGLLGTVG